MTTRILRLDAGANHAGSVSRPLATALVEGLSAKFPTEVTVKLSDGVPFVDALWLGGTRGESPTKSKRAIATAADGLAHHKRADQLRSNRRRFADRGIISEG